MKTSPNGVALLHSFESCEADAYPDPNSMLGAACAKNKLPMRDYHKVRNWQDLHGGPWTIGWGHTGPEVHQGLVWTRHMSDTTFLKDLAVREKIVDDNVKVALTQSQFDAMVSIIYNVGAGGRTKSGIIKLKDGAPSTLLRKLNAGDYSGAAAQFLVWISKGTTSEKGLTIRRAAEKALFEGGDWKAAAEKARAAWGKS